MATTPANARKWIDRTAAIIALLVFLATLGLLIWGHSQAEVRMKTTSTWIVVTNDPSTSTTSGTSTETVTGKPPTSTDGKTSGETQTGGTRQETTTTSDVADDNSLLGRAFDNPMVWIVLEILLALLAGFLAGATVQRVLLGSYGIKIGDLELEAIPPVSTAEVKEATKDLIDAKAIPGKIKPRVAAQRPSWADSPDEISSDLRLTNIALRINFEVGIRAVARRHEMRGSLALSISGLSEQELISDDYVRVAFELLALGDRLLNGADITDAAAVLLKSAFRHAIDELVKLMGPA